MGKRNYPDGIIADEIRANSIYENNTLLSGIYQALSAKGQANGYASLGADGKVPSSQLPSFVDDVLEYADTASFPAPGETGKLYVALDSDLVYRWSGSTYIHVGGSGTGAITGSGTINKLAKWSTTSSLTDSGISDDGTTVEISLRLHMTKYGDSTYVGTDCGLISNNNIKGTGFGYQALYSLTSGVNNTGIGYRALYDLATGANNVGIGTEAGQNISSGGNNIAIGRSALNNNQVTNFNIAIGSNSLYNLIYGGWSISIGTEAGRYYGASNSLQQAVNCIYIGNAVKASANAITDEIAIGASSVGSGSYTMTLGASTQQKIIANGNLHLGTQAINEKLNVLGNLAFINGGLKDNYYHVYTLDSDQVPTSGDTVMLNTDIQHYDNSSNRMDTGSYRFAVLAKEAWMLSLTLQIQSDGVVEIMLWDDTNSVAIAVNEIDMANIRYTGLTLDYIVNPSANTRYKYKINYGGTTCTIHINSQTSGVLGSVFRAKRIVLFN